MPIYEFKCGQCSHQWDKLMKYGEVAKVCPDCQAPDPKKLVGNPGFILKGTGWAHDRYGMGKREVKYIKRGPSSRVKKA
jgi:putative FmdB family regulatory protein